MTDTVNIARSSGQWDYAAVICRGDVLDGMPTEAHSCGQVPLSEGEYARQLAKSDVLWSCPKCGSTAIFDDEYFEGRHE